MVRWRVHIFLFLMLFCNTNGQSDGHRRKHWREKFVSFGQYVDRHSPQKPKESLSSSPRFTLMAPDLLRADSPENIYLQADGLTTPITISVTIMDFTKTIRLLQVSATLDQENGFYSLKTIQLSSDHLNREEKKNKFVYLIANFEGFYSEQRLVMVSFHSGYIFIQTDKPIYNPGDNVRFRTFVSSPFFKALDSSITIDIQNPDGVVVKQLSRTRAIHGVFTDTFPLSEVVNEGIWVVTAKFDHWQQNTFTSQFEVKKYVLPAFNVTLTPKKSFLSLDDDELVVEISASYLYKEPVQGTAYVSFGVKINQEMKRLPSVKHVSNLEGGTVSLRMDEIKAVYPDIKSLVGNSVYVKASVLTKTGSDLVEAEKTGIKIVESPYVVSFKDMPKYFKPGLPLDLTILVSNHDGSPAHNVLVKLTFLDTPLIASSGSARASINMPSDHRPQTITAETAQADLRPDQQASKQITLHPYVPFDQNQKNFLYISTGTNTVSVGEVLSLRFSVSLSDQMNREHIKYITYLVLNKGKIILAKREDITDQLVTSVTLFVTSEMMPSFRIVAFYGIPWVGREEVVSDSVWIDVVDTCVGSVSFCVAEPYNVRAWKSFFVDLKLPYSVAKNEQIEIKAVIHNYDSDDLHVRVVLMKTEGVCSVAFKERHTQEVTLAAGSSIAVPYTIVPLVVGKLPLEVMVVARDMMGSDRVQKFLRVVLDGVQKTKVWSTVLNPSAQGGTQTVRVGKVELESLVPNSVPETFINVRGNVLADSIDNSISEDSLASLIQMPGGCVEQNLATITLPLIATLYLDRTNKWETVGVDRRAEALRYIRRGYDNQLAYRRSDGSYPPYRSQGASTWITAYVVKVFSMAYTLVGLDEQQICDPLLYLVNNKLQPHKGFYKEDNPVYSTTMTGGLRGDDPEITLTAFVHIAFAEAKETKVDCSTSGVDVKRASQWTSQFLTKALLIQGRRPYTVAIISYALSLLGKPDNLHQFLLQAASPDKSHWPDRENPLFTLEATGYALLALVKMGLMEEAAAPFKWLNSQRRRGGGFGSTQSTMVVLHALSEYMINKPPPDDLSLNVDIRMAGRKENRYYFNPDTAYAARSSRMPANTNLEVVAQGNGQGILEVVTHYNQLHGVEDKAPCKDFELSVDINESSEKPPADVEKSYQITIRVRALGPRDVRMVVLDISLPTGFTPENSDLDTLSSSVDRYISNFHMADNLSDRGSLIIHLFKVSHKEPEILVFRLQQNFKVGLLQPSSVTVYEYYNPDHRCSRTYSPKEDKEELSRICNNDVCRCTQGDCCVSKAENENFVNKEREMFACKSLHHVWQVKVVNVSQSYYDKYEMEITQVIKLGVEAGVEVGQKRFFVSHGGCREGLDIKFGSQYLIISPKEDQWATDPDTTRFIYMLGKDTWVERWPSAAECPSSPTMQAKCKALNDAANELSVNGCGL
ncbi:complement C3 [Nematolebias whitei]|uniref:complement C3 n=1 Tax=Nematolebias whitei TaxID=451745 RepID=UPI001896DA46|nr:complement C3 [Nematolebias whitei]